MKSTNSREAAQKQCQAVWGRVRAVWRRGLVQGWRGEAVPSTKHHGLETLVSA